MPASELKWWTRPGVESIDLGPTRKGLAQRIQSTVATWKNVRPFEGEPELLPGVRAIQAPGHSPGMVTHLVSSGGKQFLISANLSPHIQTNPEWQLAIGDRWARAFRAGSPATAPVTAHAKSQEV